MQAKSESFLFTKWSKIRDGKRRFFRSSFDLFL